MDGNLNDGDVACIRVIIARISYERKVLCAKPGFDVYSESDCSRVAVARCVLEYDATFI